MESQPGWPALDLSCSFVLISPKCKIEARECLLFRNHPWSKGANYPSMELTINSTHQGAQRAMERLPFFTHLNRSFRILYPCCHSHGHCGCGCHAQACGFISHSGNHFCNFCTIHKAQIEEIGAQFHYTRSYQNHKSTIAKWLRASPQQRQEMFSKYGVLYSILEGLLYWDATRMVNVDIMHNLILGILKDHAAFKLCIPESKSKIYFRSHRKSNDTNTSDSNSMTSNSSLDKITLREACSLRREAAKIRNESLPTTSTQKNFLPMLTPHTQHPSSGSVEIPSFDANYIPTSDIPSELDISALSDHQIKGEALEHLLQIISDTIIPLSWTRVPCKMGSPSHGILKAAEWALLYKAYIAFLMLSQHMSLDEHKSINTPRNMGQSEERANELTKNTFHLISAINISTSWPVSTADENAFSKNWKKFRLSNKHLFPKQKSKPNHHFSDHIPEIFQRWGPAQGSAPWGYEPLIGVFAKMPKNNKIRMSIDKINIFTLIKHMN
ncbi:hypothetical protein O181_071922 [Austropuccinia psidii MF-1]|uniref:Uncharacterized protein n=1 Tax=Austropuccinia psidii MF-1 TaxID=1389203 RepID=A0A9Q3F639_9BASI|nr:hypothetical protein [Austropuccinia psidii MF-1]